MWRSLKVCSLAIGPISIDDAQLQANEQTLHAERGGSHPIIGWFLPLQAVWQVSRKTHSIGT